MNTFIKKEWRESIFSMKAMYWLFGEALILAAMSLSFISVKELGLMVQSEILVTMAKIIIGIAVLITILVSAISLSNEREQGTLESILLTPNSKRKVIGSKLVNSILLWLMIFLVSVPFLIALGYGTSLILPTLAILLGFGTVVVIIFAMLSISISIFVQSSKNAIILSILFLLVTAVPLFLSTTMKAKGFGKLIDTLSPISNLIAITKETLIRQISLLGLWVYVLPIFILAALLGVLFHFAIQKLSFEEVK